jgi:hypothetical protein
MISLNEFVNNYDTPNSVVLLEGKRKVKPVDEKRLQELGKLLAGSTKHILFRSGNADGSDYFFSKGVADFNPQRLQNIIPYKGHRSRYDLASESIAMDEIDIAQDDEVAYYSKQHKGTNKLVDQYLDGKINRYTIKAAYIIRDTVKVTGYSDLTPATFAFFYDDLDKPKLGGTGHTIRVCEEKNVPYFTQTDWFQWLEK